VRYPPTVKMTRDNLAVSHERFERVVLRSIWRELVAPDGSVHRVLVPVVTWRGTGERELEARPAGKILRKTLRPRFRRGY